MGLQAHAYGKGFFVGVGDDGLYRAEQGQDWSRTHPFQGSGPELYFDGRFVNGRFVALGTGAILTSTNGLDWSATAVPLP